MIRNQPTIDRVSKHENVSERSKCVAYIVVARCVSNRVVPCPNSVACSHFAGGGPPAKFSLRVHLYNFVRAQRVIRIIARHSRKSQLQTLRSLNTSMISVGFYD